MISFTASQVLAYRFCPRFLWFGEVLQIPESQELRFKVRQGRTVHAAKERQDRGHLRKRLGVVGKRLNVYLGRPDLPFRGVVDEVLHFPDGRMAPLDWKFAEYRERVYATYRTQAAIYGMLIHAIYGAEVDRAFLVFTRSANKLVEIPLTARDFEGLWRLHAEMVAVMGGRFPKATSSKRRCLDCCYRNLCPG
ncbi:CRISPR-associated protein Cas4 [Sulfidibacter corallicola]|uniref:CRISPR-associated exonuclease Cas4 n=1 Tax=Sulfidibacter corallicola TaxID=2818388 RepID=A0A8A4TLX3_SULCO|nr:CRISPR-associated protein Cas4 [Sulfidibacter corallicola]QTD50956.1 CRISPR-associated protein Cas4 [Sulfidibacter corallicola]